MRRPRTPWTLGEKQDDIPPPMMRLIIFGISIAVALVIIYLISKLLEAKP